MKQAIVNSAVIIGLTALAGIAFWIQGIPDLEADHSAAKKVLRSIVTFPLFWAGLSTLVMVPRIWLKRVKLQDTTKKFGRIVALGVQVPALLFLCAQILIPLKFNRVLSVGMMDLLFFYFLVGVLTVIGNSLPTVPFGNRIGFRTTATLKDPIVWSKVHRFLGHNVMLAGLLSLALPLFIEARYATWIFVGILASIKAVAWVYARRLGAYANLADEVHEY